MKPPEQTDAYPALIDRGVPPAAAAAKIQSTRRGILFLVAGGIAIAGAFAFVIYTMKTTQGTPGTSMLIFAALLGLPGAYFLLAGGFLISGDAMHAAEQSGGIITRTAARALRIARPKDP